MSFGYQTRSGLTFALTLLLCGGFFMHPAAAEKSLRIPLRSDDPKSMDPVRGSTVYDNKPVSMVYETLVQYKYLVRPAELEPLMIQSMPKVTDNGKTFHFTLKSGILFHDDPCFPGGKGREVISSDVIYSWKRMADNSNLPKSWWLFQDTIEGFDEYRAEQNKAVDSGGEFDYEKPVSGLKILNDREFVVRLKKPVYRFMWVLAMFQTSIVPREGVDHYGTKFGRHPLGTGPFIMKEEDWRSGQSMTFYKNPNYREEFYPTEHMPEDKKLGFDKAAGERLPIVDKVEMPFFVQDQPMWLQFMAGKLDYTQVPAENWTKAFFKRSQRLRREFKSKGITAQAIPLLDFIFYGFNMSDPLVGGTSDKNKYLRQAINLAIDWEERNDAFYNGLNIIYDGMVPPGLDGYPKDGKAKVNYRGPNLEKARKLLAKAGYPGGKGLPRIDYYTSSGRNNQEQTEMFVRHMEKIGVDINPHLVDFSTLIEYVNNRKAPIFAFAWGSDYPDAENNLALFYSPNQSPGSNHFNYIDSDYDTMYQKMITMYPSPERTVLIEKMRDKVLEDSPYIGSMARTRYYLIHPWLKNFKPTEIFYNWVKYMDIDESKR